MKLKIDFGVPAGKIKPMNAVNNGPVYTVNADQNSGNLIPYKEARIPYARTHDASFCASYGGEHTVDITAIFPRFEADENDPASYDFHFTDEYAEKIMMAGTKVFFRLGQKIEHGSKTYGVHAPSDAKKWAVICANTVAHMNEGWADGHHYGIEYWEIWNEPNLYGKCWVGTPEQYYELYCLTAKEIKSRFPNVKVGGPAPTHFDEPWLRAFFDRVKAENAPLDFYSWHRYARNVSDITDNVRRHRALLDEYGFTDTESILDEWNYVKGWGGDDWTESLSIEVGMKGAAFASSVMAACQSEPLDMLMYYDARPCAMNGLFSLYNYRLLKTYFVIKEWGETLGSESAKISGGIPDIFASACVVDGKKRASLTYYSDDDNAVKKTFTVDLGCEGGFALYLLDETYDMKKTATVYPDEGKITLTAEPNSVIILKEE